MELFQEVGSLAAPKFLLHFSLRDFILLALTFLEVNIEVLFFLSLGWPTSRKSSDPSRERIKEVNYK